MSEKTKKTLTIIGIYFGSILLAYFLSPLSGRFYLLFRGGGGGGCPLFFIALCDSGAYLEGFIFSFLFFGSFFSWLIVKEKKLKVWLWFVSPLLLFLLFLEAFEELIIGLGLVFFGWLLARLILFVKSKTKSKTGV
ncbi:MAG: hypothetical protein V1867_01940 [Candidatus Falkowbacteria bacterium]